MRRVTIGRGRAEEDEGNAGLQRVRLTPPKRYGEVISGVFISLVGIVLGLWPLI